MTNIAKIFIVINFVLSIVYMTVAGTLLAQKWDYKQWFFEYKKNSIAEQERLNETITDLNATVKNLKVALQQRTEQAISNGDNFQKQRLENERLKRQIAELNATMNNYGAELRKLNGYLEGKEERIANLEKARDKAKEEKEEAIRAKESAQDTQQELEIQLSNMEGQISEREKLIQKQQKELFESKQLLRSIQDQGIDISRLFKQEKPLDGIIQAVSSNKPLVLISVGKDDGVEKGYQFTVYRDSQYVGRIVIEEVYKDAAAARIIKDMTKRAIRKGDNVTTRIGRTGG